MKLFFTLYLFPVEMALALINLWRLYRLFAERTFRLDFEHIFDWANVALNLNRQVASSVCAAVVLYWLLWCGPNMSLGWTEADRFRRDLWPQQAWLGVVTILIGAVWKLLGMESTVMKMRKIRERDGERWTGSLAIFNIWPLNGERFRRAYQHEAN